MFQELDDKAWPVTYCVSQAAGGRHFVAYMGVPAEGVAAAGTPHPF
jgi:hypothetical protein